MAPLAPRHRSRRYRWLRPLLIVLLFAVLWYCATAPGVTTSGTTQRPPPTDENNPPFDPATTTFPADGGPIRYTGYDFTKAPGFAYPRPVPGQQVVRHTGFALGYSEPDEQAAWVAYQLTGIEVAGEVDRTDNFREDRQVTTGSAAAADYRNSGYDRGHLAPAGDMKWSEQAMSETFLFSNMSPQAPAFNRGIWNQLEQQVRAWAVRDGDLYVVTGPVLEPGLKKIGEGGVSVPRYFYKVVLDARAPELKAIAFLLPNRGSRKELATFVVSIDSVEQRTGLDFFPQLPDELETVLEAANGTRGWF